MGCNQKDEYSSEYKWWEHTYNRAAKKVSDALDKSETDEAKKEKKKKRKREEEEQDNSKKSIYSRFEKVSGTRSAAMSILLIRLSRVRC